MAQFPSDASILCLVAIGGIMEFADRRGPAPPPIQVDKEEIRQRREAAAERAREEVQETLRRAEEEFEAGGRRASSRAAAPKPVASRPTRTWCADAQAAAWRHMYLSFLKIRIDCTGEERRLVGPRGIQPGTAFAETLKERGLVEQMEILGYARTRLIFNQGMMEYCTERMTSAATAELGRDFIRSCFDDMVEYREIAYAITGATWHTFWDGDREATIEAIDDWLRTVGWLHVPPGKVEGYPGDTVFRMVETPLVR